MSSNSDSTDYINNPLGLRPVCVDDGTSCCNCYEYSFPCPNHLEELPESPIQTTCIDTPIETRFMSYKEYIDDSFVDLLVDELGKIPESYQEYCELKELYREMPNLEFQPI